MSDKFDTQRNPGEPFTRITAKTAREMLKEGQVQLIDVRNPDEYANGHIPEAKLIPIDDMFIRAEELDKDKRLIFTCSVGVRSALACEIAAAVGYSDLYNIEGGTEAWIENAYPIET